jgi:hypothetical protein
LAGTIREMAHFRPSALARSKFSIRVSPAANAASPEDIAVLRSLSGKERTFLAGRSRFLNIFAAVLGCNVQTPSLNTGGVWHAMFRCLNTLSTLSQNLFTPFCQSPLGICAARALRISAFRTGSRVATTGSNSGDVPKSRTAISPSYSPPFPVGEKHSQIV